MAERQGTEAGGVQMTRSRIASVIVVAIVVAIVVFLVARGGDDSENKRATPRAASRQDLVSLQDKLGRPLYWAGARSGAKYELTQTTGGNVYIRYLPQGTSLGDPRPGFLTVGTYPLANGYARLVAAAKKQGGKLRKREDGGIVVVTRGRPSSAYLAYPRKGFQVEVYDPDPGRAVKLALSTRIRPVR